MRAKWRNRSRGYVRTQATSPRVPYSTCPVLERGIERIGAGDYAPTAAAADRDRQATPERRQVFERFSELTRCKGVVHASHARKRQGLLSRDSRYRRPSLSRLLPSSCRVAESTARRWYSRL